MKPSNSPSYFLHGLQVVSQSDDVYAVRDGLRELGSVVRFWLPQADSTQVRRFRAFGENFETLGQAVLEFTKIAGVRLGPNASEGDKVSVIQRELARLDRKDARKGRR